VSYVERVGNLDAEIEKFLERERLAVDMLAQCLAVDEFHGDEWLMILLTNVVDGADAGVVEGGGGVGFAAKTFKGVRIVRHVRREKFQGDEAVEAGVRGFVDFTHSSGAEFLDDVEVSNGAVNHE
jgi:hypothetical protein